MNERTHGCDGSEAGPRSAPLATDESEERGDLSAPWPPELFDDCEYTLGALGDVIDESFGVGLWRHAWSRRVRR